MKRIIIACALTVLFLTGVAWAEPIELKFATMDPAQTAPVAKVYGPWVERINKASEGTLNISIYPGGVLGRDPGVQLKLVQDGVADIALIVNTYSPGRFPDDVVFEVPLLADNIMASSVASQRLYEMGLLSGYDDIKLLGHYTTGVYYLHTSFPVRVPADLQGRKFRVANKIQADFYKDMGVVGIGMPITKSAENMSRGVIDGTMCDLSALLTFRIDEVARHHLLVPMGASSLSVVMNKEKYESLPDKAKAALDKHGADVVRMWAEAIGEHTQKNLKMLEADPKHTVVHPTKEEMDKWIEIILPVFKAWEKDNPQLSNLIKVYKEEVAKVNSGG